MRAGEAGGAAAELHALAGDAFRRLLSLLLKRDERGAWQRRYCALVPQTLLFYYDDETSDDARGIIDLEYYGDVQIVRGRTLRLATASDVPLRSFFFQAETEEQAQKWCEALSRERYFVVADERDAYRELQGEFSTTRAQDDEATLKLREASQERNAAASLSTCATTTVSSGRAHRATRCAKCCGAAR